MCTSYEEFIHQTEDLNNMECYTLLQLRAKHIGYNVTKVVYRGFEASQALQATHDDAVRTRMKLKLDAESEEQEQTIMEFRLKREKERTKLSKAGDWARGLGLRAAAGGGRLGPPQWLHTVA